MSSAGLSGPSRPVWALAAAVVVIVVVVGIVVAFGVIPYPALPSVAEQPEPPITAQLAYTEYSRSDGPCLHLVDGRGQDREVGCGSTYEGTVEWLEDGRLGVRTHRFDPDGMGLAVIDLETGAVVERLEATGDDPVGLQHSNADGEEVRTGGRDSLVWLEVQGADGARRVVELEGPDSYQLHAAGWSADGDWIVAQDSIGRVLVVAPDGQDEARIWTTDVSGIAVR